jgi:hypothetical protein
MNTVTRNEARTILTVIFMFVLRWRVSSEVNAEGWNDVFLVVLCAVISAVAAFVLIPPRPRD